MSSAISRRKLIAAGLGSVAGAAGLAVAAQLADRYGLIPPDHGGIYGVGETLTFASQRLLTSRHSLAREFRRDQISKVAPVNGEPPQNDTYQALLGKGFTEWRLRIDGLVSRPGFLSLPDLQRIPVRSQITMQACEEGWSFIAEWTGAVLADVLQSTGILPQAKFVLFFPFDQEWGWESLDMADALHPQTLLAYGMNGDVLPTQHGAPLRLRVPRQLGYKSVKFLSRILVTDSVKGFGKGLGSSSPEIGYSWYAGI